MTRGGMRQGIRRRRAQLVVVVVALVFLGNGCSSSQPKASPSSTTIPTTLPFAPPVTPEPGQAFVGY